MATKKQINKTSVVETPAPAEKSKKTASAKTKAPKIEAETVKAAKPAAAKKVAATANTRKVNFILPKEAVENAETVALLGDFNNWDVKKSVQLKKQKDGSFATALELESGRDYQFRFLIDGAKWENAWNADAYEPTPFGTFNSVVKA